MFEDDIEVSPYYFDYILLTLKNALNAKGSEKERDFLVGISLTTPRFNEANIPHRAFFPDSLIGSDPKAFSTPDSIPDQFQIDKLGKVANCNWVFSHLFFSLNLIKSIRQGIRDPLARPVNIASSFALCPPDN